MTRMEVPIRLRFFRVPTKWEMREVSGDARHAPEIFAFPTCRVDDSLAAFKTTELDPWKCREAFFDLPEGDNPALRKFLQKVGLWFNADMDSGGLGHWAEDIRNHCESGNPLPISVTGLWRFRRGLQGALLDDAAFKLDYAPRLTQPETGFDIYWQSRQSGPIFPLQFELTDVASGVITLSNAYEALIATALFDIAREIRFKICARETCKRPFPLKSKRAKIFCSVKCAHAETEKRNRPLRPKSDPAKKSL
jgi:hypothetical protein